MQPPHYRVDKPVVLHVRVVTGTGGGPDKTILNSPRFLETRYQALCAYLHPPADPGFQEIEQRARQWNAPLISIPDRGPFDWRVVPQAMTVCRREKVAIWHGHDYKSNLLGLLLSRFWRMRLVTTVHGWVKHTNRTPLYYKIDRFCLPRYDQVIAVSEDLLQQSLACGAPTERCHLIENAIDTLEFSRQCAPALARQKLGLNPNRFVIGAVGRLSEEKGFHHLIRACSVLLSEGLSIELLIIGEGEQEAELRALARSEGCQHHVHLLGFQSDTRSLYEAMDLFVLSSLREGLPNVVLEAMAMKVPVLATRIAGVPRLIKDRENGKLIESGSVEQLITGIRELIVNHELRGQFATVARAISEDRYSFAQRMKKVAAVYDRLLQPPTRNGIP